VAAIERFEDVRELSDAELHVLLERGRPEQRVWAIWALALRSANIAELGHRTEPDAGVRRNLAVVLAGHGQHDLLVALAHRDPSPDVRGAAMQLATRLALDGKLPAAMVAERALTDAPEVRIAVLGTVFDTAPAWLIEVALKLLDDREGDVRYEAFEALIRAGRAEHALMWLEESPESEARLALMRWTARAGARTVAQTLARSSRRLRRLLVESVRAVDWEHLGPAVGDDAALIRALARRNPRVFEQMPLASLVRATLREPTSAWLAMVRDRLAQLEAPDDSVAPLLHDLRDACVAKLAELDAAVGALGKRRAPDVEEQLAVLDDERVAIEHALEQAARLLVH
jgi:hypothetical protein